MAEEVTHYCDPEWHDGEKIDAHYLIRAINKIYDPDKDPHAHGGSSARFDDIVGYNGARFAACRTHVETALHVMISRWKDVRVIEVNK
jgi:hypothetical protein